MDINITHKKRRDNYEIVYSHSSHLDEYSHTLFLATIQQKHSGGANPSLAEEERKTVKHHTRSWWHKKWSVNLIFVRIDTELRWDVCYSASVGCNFNSTYKAVILDVITPADFSAQFSLTSASLSRLLWQMGCHFWTTLVIVRLNTTRAEQISPLLL